MTKIKLINVYIFLKEKTKANTHGTWENLKVFKPRIVSNKKELNLLQQMSQIKFILQNVIMNRFYDFQVTLFYNSLQKGKNLNPK